MCHSSAKNPTMPSYYLSTKSKLNSSCQNHNDLTSSITSRKENGGLNMATNCLQFLLLFPKYGVSLSLPYTNKMWQKGQCVALDTWPFFALALLEHYYVRNLGYPAREAKWKGSN